MNLTALFTFEHIRVGVALLVIIVLYMVLCVHTMTNANLKWQHAYCLLVLFVASALVVVGVASRNRSYVQYPFIVSMFFFIVVKALTVLGALFGSPSCPVHLV
jgi:hypothetical protein